MPPLFNLKLLKIIKYLTSFYYYKILIFIYSNLNIYLEIMKIM